MNSFKPIVIDACTVLAWGFGEEVHAPKVEALREFLSTGSAIVPSIFPVEVIGGLVVGQRRGRITKPQADAFLDGLELLPIIVDDEQPQTMEYCRWPIMELCERYGLKAKDACYLDLAFRRDFRLATFDHDLSKAAMETERAFFM